MTAIHDDLLVKIEDRVCTIILNRPNSLNSLTPELLQALDSALVDAAENEDVGVLVLTGMGKAFSAGGDMKALASHSKKEMSFEDRVQGLLCSAESYAGRLHQMPKPTIAMIRGAAAGGGLAIALGCDLRIASETAKFTFAYTKIGVPGDFGVTYFLQKLLGTTKALEFCLLSPKVGAEEALAIGLVNRVVPDADLEISTYEIARSLAAGPPLALAAIKQNLFAAEHESMKDAFTVEAGNFARCYASEDSQKAILAFLEKRTSLFAGR